MLPTAGNAIILASLGKNAKTANVSIISLIQPSIVLVMRLIRGTILPTAADVIINAAAENIVLSEAAVQYPGSVKLRASRVPVTSFIPIVIPRIAAAAISNAA